MYYSTASRETSALLASEKTLGVLSEALPNDQWMIEISGWFAVSLARLQHALIEYVTDADLPSQLENIAPADADGQALCSAQMVGNTGAYTNVSVFGLATTLVIGGLIIALSLVLEPVVGSFRERSPDDPVQKRMQWILDGKFQLLRMAVEYSGAPGVWTRTDRHVPVVATATAAEPMLVLPSPKDPCWPGWKTTAVVPPAAPDGASAAIPTMTQRPMSAADRSGSMIPLLLSHHATAGPGPGPDVAPDARPTPSRTTSDLRSLTPAADTSAGPRAEEPTIRRKPMSPSPAPAFVRPVPAPQFIPRVPVPVPVPASAPVPVPAPTRGGSSQHQSSSSAVGTTPHHQSNSTSTS